jgi:hypothetical protein
VNILETVSSEGCYLYHFVLDIISVQFPFVRHRLQMAKDKYNSISGYCFINLILIFAFKHFRTI